MIGGEGKKGVMEEQKTEESVGTNGSWKRLNKQEKKKVPGKNQPMNRKIDKAKKKQVY